MIAPAAAVRAAAAVLHTHSQNFARLALARIKELEEVTTSLKRRVFSKPHVACRDVIGRSRFSRYLGRSVLPIAFVGVGQLKDRKDGPNAREH